MCRSTQTGNYLNNLPSLFVIFSILFNNNDGPNCGVLWDTSAFCFCEKKGKQIMTKYQRRHRCCLALLFTDFAISGLKSHRVDNFEVHNLIVKILKNIQELTWKIKNKIHQKIVSLSNKIWNRKQNTAFPRIVSSHE